METILDDFDKQQQTLADLKFENSNKTKIISEKEQIVGKLQSLIKENELKINEFERRHAALNNESCNNSFINGQNSNLILKMEKDNTRLENENHQLKSDYEHHKKIAKDMSAKYQTVAEKAKHIQKIENSIKSLEIENQSLNDQIMVFKKLNVEQKKVYKNEPTEMASAVNSLKATVTKRENTIKELKAEIQVLQNLLDEARLEIGNDDRSEKSERTNFADALDMLDTIISRPLGVSSSNKGQEFAAILKRVQLIKDQSEDPVIQNIISFVRDHLPDDFDDNHKS